MEKGDEQSIGRCHICQREPIPVSFCPTCEHWFCPECRVKWFDRSWAALVELFGGKTVKCCHGSEGE